MRIPFTQAKEILRPLLALLLFMAAFSSVHAQSNVRVATQPIGEPITISGQPSANSSYCVGSFVGLTVIASNVTAYKWQVDKGSGFNNIDDDATYSGTTTQSLSILGLTSGMNGYKYQVVLTGTGTPNVTSNTVTIALIPAPNVTIPPADASVLVGKNKTFMVTASYTTVYKWQVLVGADYTDIANAAPYSGATSSTLTITGVTSALNGNSYRVIGTGVCSGNPSATSAAAILTVKPAPSISVDPVNSTICVGANTTFSVTATDATGYEWKVDKGAGFVTINEVAPYSGTTSAVLTITGATAALSGYKYQAIAKGFDASKTTSGTALLSFNPSTAISAEPSGAVACAGSGTSFSVTASNATGYQWQVDKGAGFADISEAAPYSGTTTSVLTLTAATADMTGYQYKCIVSGGCSGATSEAVTLTVQAPGQWLGVDTDWNNTANWGCGTIPTATTNVVVSSDAEFMPDIDFVYDAICNNLTIGSGAMLSVSSGELEIVGQVLIIDTGIFSRSGPINFSGGDDQVIPSGSYGDLKITGDHVRTLAGDVSVSALLIFAGGQIKLGNYNILVESTGEIMPDVDNSFAITDGTGKLKWDGLGVGGKNYSVVFPIGASADSYTPIRFKNTGVKDQFAASVITGVYAAYEADDSPTGSALTNFNVNKTWFITEAEAGGSIVDLTFEWVDGDAHGDFLKGNCFGSHYMNGKWNPGTAGEAGLEERNLISLNGVTSFSPFGVGSTGSALPLKLLSFTAVPNAENISLKWETVNEVKTAGFDIEVSKDALAFTKVGNLESLKNDFSIKSTYHFDSGYPKGVATSYFRLKMLDQDGSYSYSKIVKVLNSEAISNYQVYPNPVQNEFLTVKSGSTATGPLEITIFDMRGLVLYQSQVDSKSVSQDRFLIPVKNLHHGANYIMRIADANAGTSQSVPFFRK